jgi:hypothetical protein
MHRDLLIVGRMNYIAPMPAIRIRLHRSTRKQIKFGDPEWWGTLTTMQDVPKGTTYAIVGKATKLFAMNIVNMKTKKNERSVSG